MSRFNANDARILGLIKDAPKTLAAIAKAVDLDIDDVRKHVSRLSQRQLLRVVDSKAYYGKKTSSYGLTLRGRTRLANMMAEAATKPAAKAKTLSHEIPLGMRAHVVKRWNEWGDLQRIADHYQFDKGKLKEFLQTRAGYPGKCTPARLAPAPPPPAENVTRNRHGISLPRLSCVERELP
jgi:predicted ArsR family transcriptional regulator